MTQNQTVALFPGLSVDELSSLLKTIFGIPSSQTIVGVNAEVLKLSYLLPADI